MPPLPANDQRLLDDHKMSVDVYGNTLYKGVCITVAYDPDWRMYYYILPGLDKRVFSLDEAFYLIDVALAKLDAIGEPYD